MKTVALFSNSSKPNAKEYAKEAAMLLKNLGANVIALQQFCEQLGEEYDFIDGGSISDLQKNADFLLTFGGDGTILSAAKLFLQTGIPIMGINVGRLGFLAEYPADSLKKSMSDLMNGNYRMVERLVLEAVIKDEKFYALNDFVLEKSVSSRMITVRAYANDNHVADYKADGLITATPTGSTAYSLSSGGPIIAPGTPVFCLTPISPHTLNLRPLVIPDSSEVKLVLHSRNGSAQFAIDGGEVCNIASGESVLIKRSSEKIKLLKPLDTSYYDLLREKLLWATDAKKSSDEF